MKKVLKIVLYILLGLVVFTLIMAAMGTRGLKEARNLEIASINLIQVKDGQYQGRYENGRWTNGVNVTVENHKITSIEHLEIGNPAQTQVFVQIIDEILNQQKVDIDTMSGATASTNSFLKAVEDAFN